jgi:hypothetical protein
MGYAMKFHTVQLLVQSIIKFVKLKYQQINFDRKKCCCEYFVIELQL